MSEINCPHCNGTGKVAEDFLTTSFVSAVAKDWCTVFNNSWAYGLHDYTDGHEYVYVTIDVSCRGCTDYEGYEIPKKYFIRDQTERLRLMHEDLAAEKAAEAEEQRLRSVKAQEAKVARLKKEIDNPSAKMAEFLAAQQELRKLKGHT